MSADAEKTRLEQARTRAAHWKKWGPYLSERQWGTVREDYSDNGDAWNYFTHDQARSRAYRWGEDGLAGISDDHQVLCFALALWNGRDPILKERALRPGQQRGQPRRGREGVLLLPRQHADALVHEVPVQVPAGGLSLRRHRRRPTASRGKHEPEYELLDTGVFDDDRYFDVFVEYAKAAPDDVLVRISASNRGPEAAPLHVLPTLWFRNTWSQRRRRLQARAETARRQRPRRVVMRAPHRRAVPGIAGRLLPLLRRRRAAAVHRERDQPRAGCSARRTRRRT